MDDWLLPARLCEQTSAFLDAVYSDELALYPFTTSVVDARYVSDYRSRGALRYTVNTLLGRARAARACVDGAPNAERVRDQYDAFVRRYGDDLGAGDRGLLLVLLAELDAPEREVRSAVTYATVAVGRERLSRLDLQDLAWLVWGACSVGAESLADDAFAALLRLAGRNVLARHARGSFRPHVVSFGGTAYFLRALDEYGRAFGDAGARARFERGVRAVIGSQGAHGEWPWLLGVATGDVLDAYPVYSVHQLAMAPLFLLPAIDAGIDGAADALRRGYRWADGDNELGLPFGHRDPFLLFRAIERREPLPKLTRFARATVRAAVDRPAVRAPRRTRVNGEWRSYEGGWLLYAWAGRGAGLVEDSGARTKDWPIGQAPASALSG